MTRRQKTATLALLMLNGALAALLLQPAATAHSGYNEYREWPVNATEPYYIDNNVPSGWRADIKFGLGVWSDKVDGRAPNFVFQDATVADMDWAHPCGGTKSIVFSIDDLGLRLGGSDGVIAATILCPNEGSGPQIAPEKFKIFFDSNPVGTGFPGSAGWWTGATSPPSNRWDLRSAAVHESGHAAGHVYFNNGHFSEVDDDACPDSNVSARSTMCPGRNNADMGTIYVRSLEENHDWHTLRGAYS